MTFPDTTLAVEGGGRCYHINIMWCRSLACCHLKGRSFLLPFGWEWRFWLPTWFPLTLVRLASLHWVIVKVLFCMRPPLTLLQWSGEGDCWFGEEVLVLHMVSSDTQGRGRSCYWPVKMKVPDLYLDLFDTTLVMVLKYLIIVFWEYKTRLPTCPLLIWVGVEPQFFQWYMTGVQQLLSKSFLFY